ncbi:heterokaryon incompatibility protein Het-C-domain-containing protein [Collybia nuda]|uniref:Heterokaryon incompatibility protein Het-C-domain-containing protein n=1 Tax=Collybia nuda TaxID=64659 RepID=A0A9P6CFH4_9AGAR|nr:heterokaryon incompatibility protein Het-C-domain-containing protein [Collybia nuda]
MPSNITILLLLVFIFAVCLSGNGVYAFGAGNIPSFAYMEGRAFRHGDIEDALAELIKRGSGGGFALASMLSKGHKFNGLDIKRVYFGNWLRDYSQAIDIATLKKLPKQTIMNLIMVLGFMAHGYATNEFEVTPERLGVYLPTEHIDNPKGYGDGEDPRAYDNRLRGPVDPRELEVDPRTGMKNYIANEQGSWDTSKALVRRTLERCIHLGRQHRSQGRKEDEYEAYRLLGTALHTLEDFTAHSNFCELVLVALGHADVFLHVGDQVRIQAPNGKWVAPIVTGTFGGNDFAHSMLGEATDHLSQASVSDLNKELDKARSVQSQSRGPGGGPSNPGDMLRDLFFNLPGGVGGEMSRDLDSVERIRAGPAQGGKRPEDMSPQELHAVLWQVLTFRDSVMKKISKTIEKIPGLGPMIDKLVDSISVFVFTTLEPFLKPILKTTTAGLHEVSGEVINSHDQYEVFNDPRASDPTHSFLSKDHFNLILNEPAGQIARIVVINTVGLVTKAWDDTSQNVHAITEEILQCLFHPDFHQGNSKVQREMIQCMHNWVKGLGKREKQILQRLTKNAVRNHENIRAAGDGGKPAAQGTYAEAQGLQFQHTLQGYATQIPGVSQAQQIFGSGGGGRRDGAPGAPGAYSGVAPGGYSGPAQSAPPSSTGQAASYYNEGAKPPSAPSYSAGAPTSSYTPTYAPPAGPPPSFSGSTPSFPGSAPPHAPAAPSHSGYTPSYAPSYSSPPPSFPGGASSFPGGPPPSFPGGPSPSFPGGPPSFPGGPGGGHDQGGYGAHQGGYGPPPGPPPGGPGFPAAPGFPGANPHQTSSPPPHFPGGPGSYQGGQGGW